MPPVLRRPAAANQGSRRQGQQQLRQFVMAVTQGRKQLNDAPNYELAKAAAKALRRQLTCSICGRHTREADLSFTQWSEHVWTAYCIRCEAGYPD